ncbi:hypothetical protein ABZP36_006546 [Zizania latifolia]
MGPSGAGEDGEQGVGSGGGDGNARLLRRHDDAFCSRRLCSDGRKGSAAFAAQAERTTDGRRAAAGEVWRFRRCRYGREGSIAFPSVAERTVDGRHGAAGEPGRFRRCPYGREGSIAFPSVAERTVDGWHGAASEPWRFRRCRYGREGSAACTAEAERTTDGRRAAAGEVWRFRRCRYGREGSIAFPSGAERTVDGRRAAASEVWGFRRCRYGREGSIAFPSGAERTVDGWRAAASEIWRFRRCRYGSEGSIALPSSVAERTVDGRRGAAGEAWRFRRCRYGSEDSIAFPSGAERTVDGRCTHAGSAAEGNDARSDDESKRSGKANGDVAGQSNDPLRKWSRHSDRKSSCAAATHTGSISGKEPREPARGMPPSTSGATHRMPALPPPLWQAAAAAAAAMPPSLSQAHGTVHHPFPYDGVKQDAFTGKWAATVFDPDLNDVRLVGAFPDEHTAALAHDRLDIAFHSDRARVNFKPAFHDVELQFLRRCRAKKNVFDICAIVGDGTYDEHYAKFLSTLYQQAMYHSGARSFTNVILDFFICRASEIWREADDAGDEKLAERFVDMHKNKATNPRWREWYHRKVAQQHPQQLQGAAVNKRKADDEDDQQHKRQLLRTQQQE